MLSESLGFVESGSSPPKHLFKLLTRDALRKLPRPEWLVEGVLPEKGVVFLFGAPAEGKSFVALDLAMSVALGAEWLGRETKRGAVVYVAPEGFWGLPARCDAWETDRKRVVSENLFVQTEAILLNEDTSVARFIESVKATSPRLIIIDTFARSFDGDENSAKEVSQAIRGLDKMVATLGALVVVVHHTVKAKKGRTASERGSSVLRGAADTMLRVGEAGGGRFLFCEKQKEAEHFKPIPFELKQVALASGETSAAVVLSRDTRVVAAKSSIGLNHLRLLGELAASPDSRLRWGVLVKQLGEKEGTVRHWRVHLEELGLIASPATGLWEITATGRDRLPTANVLPIAA